MAKPRNKYLDLATYLAVRLVAAVIRTLSWRACYKAATFLADMLYRFNHRCHERIVGHLSRSFPDWSQQRIEEVGRESLRNLAYLGVEFLFITQLITPSLWQRHVRLHNIKGAVRILTEQKKGVIFITGHFGNWEVVGYGVATLGFSNVAVVRRLDNPYLDEYVCGLRAKKGLRILDKKGASRELDNILDAKGAVSFVADQDAGRKGLFVDFFGRPASTYKSIALMAIRHEVPIVVGYGRRLAPQFDFEIGIEKIIYPHEWADKEDPIRWITQTYTTALEDLVRSDPSQYLWIHRRWKHRPKGEVAPKDGIA